jgi:hypothetical protein
MFCTVPYCNTINVPYVAVLYSAALPGSGASRMHQQHPAVSAADAAPLTCGSAGSCGGQGSAAAAVVMGRHKHDHQRKRAARLHSPSPTLAHAHPAQHLLGALSTPPTQPIHIDSNPHLQKLATAAVVAVASTCNCHAAHTRRASNHMFLLPPCWPLENVPRTTNLHELADAAVVAVGPPGNCPHRPAPVKLIAILGRLVVLVGRD